MKKQWEYKYPDRLFEAMVSEDHVLIDDELFFAHMTNGRYPNAGIYSVNAATGEARTGSRRTTSCVSSEHPTETHSSSHL